MPSVSELGKLVKQKYPGVYDSLSDADLGKKVQEKYPDAYKQFTQKVVPTASLPDKARSTASFLPGEALPAAEKVARGLAPKSVEGFGDTIGTSLAVAGGVTGKIDKSAVSEADSRFNLAKQLRTATPEQAARIRSQLKAPPSVGTASQQISSVNKTNKQVAAEALGTLGTAALGASAGGGIAGRLALGTAVGAGTGLKEGLEQNATAGETAKKALVGGAVGLGLGLVFEGIGAALGAAAKRFKPGDVLNRELRPSNKLLVPQLERGIQTFGDEAAQITDDAGKQLYRGTPKQILKIAQDDIKNQGTLLRENVRGYNDKFLVDRKDITGDIMTKIQDEFGALKPSEMKSVTQEFGRINKMKLNAEDLLDFKQQVDAKIPDTFWDDLVSGDRPKAIASYTKYLMRDNLRKALNENTADPVIQAINDRLSIGFDVRKLAAVRVANEAKRGWPVSLTSAIGRLFESTFANPNVTTRIPTAVGGIRNAVGPASQPLRSAVTTGIAGAVSGE